MFLSRDINVGPQSPYAKEIVKWEANFTQYGPPGRPYEYTAFPTRLYKARRPHHGEIGEYIRVKVDGSEVGNVVWEAVTAETEVEASNLERSGFVIGGQLAALEHLVKLEAFVAEAAAERHFSDRKMSDKAQAEVAAKDDRTVQHLGEIPADPLPAKNRKVEVTK